MTSYLVDTHILLWLFNDDSKLSQKARNIVGNRIHIFTKAEIMEDMIGIDHHEEILPSQEQMDFEEAQRHIARLGKMAKEMWEKRKKKKK